jgi:hypothetical protein
MVIEVFYLYYSLVSSRRTASEKFKHPPKRLDASGSNGGSRLTGRQQYTIRPNTVHEGGYEK